MNMSEKTMAGLVLAMVAIGFWVASLPKSRPPVAQPPASSFYLKRLANALAEPLDDLASSKELEQARTVTTQGICNALDAAVGTQKKEK